MKAQKVVKIEVLDDCDGVVLVFGIDGERGAASHHSRWGRGCFTETARLHVEWEDGGRQLSHFHNWIAAVPRLHPTETLADAVERVMREAAGWDMQGEEDFPVPSMSGGSRTRGRLAMAA